MEVTRAEGLYGLSKERIRKAIEKVNLRKQNDEYQLKLLDEDLQNAALMFMKENFLPQEPLVQLFGVHWDEDAERFWNAVFDQRMTLILTSKGENDIIALRGIEVIIKTDRMDTNGIADENLRNLLDYLNFCDDHAKFFKHYGVDKAIHFAGLAVSQAHRRKGIATEMLTYAVSFIENLGLKDVCIRGEASSDYSKKVYEKLDFDELYEQKYEEYMLNGKHLMLGKTTHKSNKIYGKRVVMSC